jgi:hypothetical protein
MKPAEERDAQRRSFFSRASGVAGVFAAVATGVASMREPQAASPSAARQSAPAADRALWISWYDLLAEGRDAYLAWVHGTYIPALLKRPGFMWAAHYASVERGSMRTLRREGATYGTEVAGVPTGDRYILIFAAEHSNVFGNPVPSALHAELDDADRKLLALRVRERVNVMVEAARIDGPELAGYKDGIAPAPCMQLGSFNCVPEHEEEMLAWYAQSRMPAMEKLPGCIRTRKLASVSGWAKHAILYEYVSLEARNKNYLMLEQANPAAKAWADKMVPYLIHAPGSANLATRIWPPLAA